MKVKIFEDYKTEDLEKAINEFLGSIEPKREGASSIVVDIKYSSHSVEEYWPSPISGEPRLQGTTSIYTALIIYK